MSAPAGERTRTAARVGIPAQRSAPAAAPRRAAVTGQDAARKAYARREDRVRRAAGGRSARTPGTAGRAQFVLLVMVLLVVGLVATLWLSTAAAADSYRLQDARAEARTLSQQSERLHREVAAMDSAPELARRAGALGMVPVQDTARLVVAPDGTVSVVGQPRAATAPAPVLPPAPPAPPAPTDPPVVPAEVASQLPPADPATGGAPVVDPAAVAAPGTG